MKKVFPLRGTMVISILSLTLGYPQPAAGLYRPLHVAVVGDRTGGYESGIYGQIIKEIGYLRPDLVITVGDQIEGYTADSFELNHQWEEYKELLTPLTMPIHFTPGNHDIFDEVSLALYRRHEK